ncbi:HTH_Tnp_Tc3_2 domain-containing protein [Trichonephila clavipes]|nr:HTH_Tnp_Tc3_2 domain-containing protein [Trichonephila clavipes]
MLGRRIAAHQLPPTCLSELRRALLDEWCNIPHDQIDNLILSMPRRSRQMSRDSQVVMVPNLSSLLFPSNSSPEATSNPVKREADSRLTAWAQNLPVDVKLLGAGTPEGTHARKTGAEATRKTTRREDRRIVRQALEDPTVTRSTIRAGVGIAIVPQTISRHLAEANLKSKRPFRALPLTPEHRQLRLQWCQARSM